MMTEIERDEPSSGERPRHSEAAQTQSQEQPSLPSAKLESEVEGNEACSLNLYPQIENTIVYLIGVPGSGKYTIAKEIGKNAPFVLVDNHLINDPVFSLIDTASRSGIPNEAWEFVDRVRDVTLDVIRKLGDPCASYVFTNWLVEGERDDAKYFEDVEQLAKARGATFLPIKMLINEEQLLRRVVSEDRQQKCKSTDPEVARRILREEPLFSPDRALELDVSHLSPEMAARRILDECVRRAQIEKESSSS